MANVFDQFDSQASAPSQAATQNVFDQFDQKQPQKNVFDQFDTSPNSGHAYLPRFVEASQVHPKPTASQPGQPEPVEAIQPHGFVDNLIAGMGVSGMKAAGGISDILGAKVFGKSLTDTANEFQQRAPANTPIDSIGRGIGSGLLLMSAGLPGALTQAGASAFGDEYAKSGDVGHATVAALKAVPEMAAYWLIGAGAGRLVAPLLSQASPLVKGAVGAGAATLANMLSSAVIRKAEGQSIAPDAQGTAQDVLFGILHGVGSGFEASKSDATIREGLKTAPDSALQTAAADPEFRRTAPYNPKFIDDEIERRKNDPQAQAASNAEAQGAVETATALREKTQTQPEKQGGETNAADNKKAGNAPENVVAPAQGEHGNQADEGKQNREGRSSQEVQEVLTQPGAPGEQTPPAPQPNEVSTTSQQPGTQADQERQVAQQSEAPGTKAPSEVSEVDQQLRGAAQKIGDKQGSHAAIPIGDLMQEMGWSKQQTEKYLLDQAQKGNLVLHPAQLPESDMPKHWLEGIIRVPGFDPYVTFSFKEPKKGSEQNATQKVQQQESVQGERPRGDQGGTTAEAGGSNRVLDATQSEGQTPVTITAAAYRNPETGEVTTGQDHFEAAEKAGVKAPAAREDRESPEYGFMTSDGQFVSREQADKIATISGQKVDEPDRPGQIHSDQIDIPKPEVPKTPRQMLEDTFNALHEDETSEQMMARLGKLQDETVRKKIAYRLGIETKGKTADELNAEIVEELQANRDDQPEVAPWKQPRRVVSSPSYSAMGLLRPGPFKQVIHDWWNTLRGLYNTAKSAKTFADFKNIRETIAANYDAADNRAGYIANQAENHVNLAGEATNPNSRMAQLEQSAATFVRQANGDKAGMLAKLQKIRGKGYDPIIDYVQANWDRLEKIADAAKDSTDAAFNQAQASGIDLDYRDNYVKGAYDFPFDNKVIFDEKPGAGPSTSFKKPKVFNDYAEAIAAGYEPKELRLDKLTQSAVLSSLRAVNRRAWVESLHGLTAPDGLPVARDMETVTRGGKTFQRVPQGYRLTSVGPGNAIPIHEGLSSTIQSLSSPSIFPKVLSNLAAGIKHNILVFDIFHGSRFAQMQMAFQGILRPSFKKGVTLLDYSDADLKEAERQGRITYDESKWAMANRPRLEKLMSAGLNVGRISDALYANTAPLWPLAQATNKLIFNRLSRGIITQASLYALDRNAKLYPGMSPDQLHRYTAREVNTYFRNLGNQGFLKSKSMQDAARAFLFAPQWFEGRLRSEARAYGQVLSPNEKGQVGNLGKAMATGLLGYFVAAQVINMMTRGNPTWKNAEPGHEFDAYIPDLVEGGTGLWLSPTSVFAETVGDAIKYMERGKQFMDTTVQLGANQLHPLVRAAWDILSGRDFYGRPLEGFDRFSQSFQDASPIPLAARGGQYKGQRERQLLSFAGIKTSPVESKTSDIYALADKFRQDNGLESKTEPPGVYSNLRQALQQGNMKEAQQELGKVLKTHTQGQIDKYFQRRPGLLFMGSKKLEAKFRASLSRDQLDLYIAALNEQKALAQQYQILKANMEAQ